MNKSGSYIINNIYCVFLQISKKLVASSTFNHAYAFEISSFIVIILLLLLLI